MKYIYRLLLDVFVSGLMPVALVNVSHFGVDEVSLCNKCGPNGRVRVLGGEVNILLELLVMSNCNEASSIFP